MRSPTLPFAVLVAEILLLGSAAFGGPQTNDVNTYRAETQPVSRDHFVSMLSLISSLAAERFAEDQARGETWVFGVHSGSAVLKYSDGKATVVLLPGPSDYQMSAMSTYAAYYNGWQLDKCHSLAEGGDHAKALHICRLLVRFGPEDGLETQRAKARVPLLEALADGKDVPQSKEKLEEQRTPPIAPHDLTWIRRGKATIVNDLLSLNPRN